ncbi:hypothetical protein TWF569_008017 [Orbilia oligospora]|uniref:Uncharacterized protein n=1 Tax=Orbilia oligospora TaxID=2813651 RepID=A0A7C8JQ83_ORBOL|nr:hypothetical protein TWF706_011955 [Orbilia oligospora]KAF3107365.1 hypothetical protein TWF102_000284 [Orbilia oligospora]KAF3116019.1 hypothetical protein TWF103_010244 [Orbilia oligospora]KAF3149712.1 hypothetical protein TWF594_010812 [Orbilia oligospora]KAF3155977.1 hypothetical protein TWF569_008017 [Orbilia oligospora]
MHFAASRIKPKREKTLVRVPRSLALLLALPCLALPYLHSRILAVIGREKKKGPQACPFDVLWFDWEEKERERASGKPSTLSSNFLRQSLVAKRGLGVDF